MERPDEQLREGNGTSRGAASRTRAAASEAAAALNLAAERLCPRDGENDGDGAKPGGGRRVARDPAAELRRWVRIDSED